MLFYASTIYASALAAFDITLGNPGSRVDSSLVSQRFGQFWFSCLQKFPSDTKYSLIKHRETALLFGMDLAVKA